MSHEFLMPEDETVEVKVGNAKFKIKPLTYEEFRKILEYSVSLGLVSGPFAVNEKTIKRLKFSVLSVLSNSIINLTGQRYMMEAVTKTENPNPIAG